MIFKIPLGYFLPFYQKKSQKFSINGNFWRWILSNSPETNNQRKPCDVKSDLLESDWIPLISRHKVGIMIVLPFHLEHLYSIW